MATIGFQNKGTMGYLYGSCKGYYRVLKTGLSERACDFKKGLSAQKP